MTAFGQKWAHGLQVFVSANVRREGMLTSFHCLIGQDFAYSARVLPSEP